MNEKKEIYAAYNILPLDEDGASLAIMNREEVHEIMLNTFSSISLSWFSYAYMYAE